MNEPKENLKSKGTAVTQEDFELAHLLSKSGLKLGAIANIIKRSTSTTNLLVKADSLEEYKAEIRKITSKAKPQPKKKENVDSRVTTSTNTDQIVTSVNNLTEAVITMTAILKDVATQMAIDKSKSFLRR